MTSDLRVSWGRESCKAANFLVLGLFTPLPPSSSSFWETPTPQDCLWFVLLIVWKMCTKSDLSAQSVFKSSVRTCSCDYRIKRWEIFPLSDVCSVEGFTCQEQNFTNAESKSRDDVKSKHLLLLIVQEFRDVLKGNFYFENFFKSDAAQIWRTKTPSVWIRKQFLTFTRYFSVSFIFYLHFVFESLETCDLFDIELNSFMPVINFQWLSNYICNYFITCDFGSYSTPYVTIISPVASVCP